MLDKTPGTLYYVHDPMCSWCWAFRPVWQQLRGKLPDSVRTRSLVGGLAADNDLPMAEPMKEQLQATWRQIETAVPGTVFNHNFWRDCQPRRSSYPACRAVIAAKALQTGMDEIMTLAIQQAYYTRAMNPSDDAVLIRLAGECGLEETRFATALNSQETRDAFAAELQQVAELGVSSFPSLVLEVDGSRWPVAINYREVEEMLFQIDGILGMR